MTAIEFRAPWGPMLRARTLVWSASLAVMMLVALVGLTSGGPLPWVLMVIAVPSLILAAAAARCVRGYTLTEEAITVHRGIGRTVLSLAGLRSVKGDVDALRGSIRVFGNYGFFCITGRCWSRKLGWHRVFATDLSRAVVLRYSDRTVVITPHDPQQFIMRAGTFIKTAGFPK